MLFLVFFFQSEARCLPSLTGKVWKTPTRFSSAMWHRFTQHGLFSESEFTTGVRDITSWFWRWSYQRSSVPLTSHPLHQSPTWTIKLSCVLEWIGKAGTVSESLWSHCWCLGMLPRNVLKHRYCPLFFQLQLNLLPLGLRGPLTAWRALKGSADYCLQSLHLENRSLHFPRWFSCSCSCRGGIWELNVLINRQNVHSKMSYYSPVEGIILVWYWKPSVVYLVLLDKTVRTENLLSQMDQSAMNDDPIIHLTLLQSTLQHCYEKAQANIWVIYCNTTYNSRTVHTQ